MPPGAPNLRSDTVRLWNITLTITTYVCHSIATRRELFIGPNCIKLLLQMSETHSSGFIFSTSFDSGSSEGSMEGYVPEWNQPGALKQVVVPLCVFSST